MRKKSHLKHEDLEKFYVKDQSQVDIKINEIKSIKLGDLLELSFKFSYPPRVIGIVKKVDQDSIIVYTNLSKEFYLNKNVLINSLEEFMNVNVWIEILNINHEQ
jgi:hypothetical protein